MKLAVIICGDRNWDDPEMIYKALDYLDAEWGLDVLIEGDATGADTAAHDWGKQHLNIYHECHPALWETEHKAAGPKRNLRMLESLLSRKDTHKLMVIGFHDDFENSKGTGHMIKSAKKKDVPTGVFSHEKV